LIGRIDFRLQRHENGSWNSAQPWGTQRMIPRLVAALVLAGSCRSATATEPSRSLTEFRDDLDRLRVSGHIESISAVIAKDQSVVWSASLGAATVTDTTVFHLASLTKPLASTVILQLADEGKVSLDDPVSKYGIVLSSTAPVLVSASPTPLRRLNHPHSSRAG
jgi:CubicO group peptidase (beta-lactamase class C family)